MDENNMEFWNTQDHISQYQLFIVTWKEIMTKV